MSIRFAQIVNVTGLSNGSSGSEMDLNRRLASSVGKATKDKCEAVGVATLEGSRFGAWLDDRANSAHGVWYCQ